MRMNRGATVYALQVLAVTAIVSCNIWLIVTQTSCPKIVEMIFANKTDSSKCPEPPATPVVNEVQCPKCDAPPPAQSQQPCPKAVESVEDAGTTSGVVKQSDIIGLDTMDERLINFTKGFLIKPHKKDPYVLERTEVSDTSLYKTASYVATLTSNKTGGFFVECGAYDGETTSNTLILERLYGWTGLLVEAAPRQIAQILIKNRRAWFAPACMSIKNSSMMVTYVDGGLGGGVRENATKGLIVKALCIPFNTLMRALDVNEVDYFSLDVEKNELDVLRTINFDEVKINIITIEHLWSREDVVRSLMELMESNGFRRIAFNAHDVIYVHKTFVLPNSFVPMSFTVDDVLKSAKNRKRFT